METTYKISDRKMQISMIQFGTNTMMRGMNFAGTTVVFP